MARTLRRMSTRGRSNENNLQKLEYSLQMTGDIRETGDTQGTQGLTVGTFVSDFSGDILKFLRLFKSMPFD